MLSILYNVSPCAAQTEQGAGLNKNKFYVAQVVEQDGGSACHCFTRWGRVGDEEKAASMISGAKKGITPVRRAASDVPALTPGCFLSGSAVQARSNLPV